MILDWILKCVEGQIAIKDITGRIKFENELWIIK